MAKGKFETNVLPNLAKIEKWAKDGATAKDIAAKLHIAYSTFRRYLDAGEKGDERYQALSAAFAQACVVPDDEVENALYKRACGIEYIETKRSQQLDREGNVVELVTTTNRFIPPDPTSAMFWLTNRRPDKWKYKPEADGSGDSEGGGVVLLPPVMDNPGPPKGGGPDG